MPRTPQRGLMKRCRDNAVDLPSQRQPGGRHQRIVCRLPTAGIDRGNWRRDHIVAANRQTKNRLRRRFHIVAVRGQTICVDNLNSRMNV